METWKIEIGGHQTFYPYVPYAARIVGMDEQSDYGLRCLIVGDIPHPIQLTHSLRIAAAAEWLRRYPDGKQDGKRWATYADSVVANLKNKGLLYMVQEV